jgi:hypothetical protein
MLVTLQDLACVVRSVRGKRNVERACLLQQCQDHGLQIDVAWGSLAEKPRQNWRRALDLAYKVERPWILQLEDDVYLGPDFAQKVLDYLGRNIANLWSFYDATTEGLAAWRNGPTQRRTTMLSNCQAVAFHRDLVQPMLAYLPAWEERHPTFHSAVDIFLREFCAHERLIVRYSAPSLVQHRQTKSLLGPRASRGRISPSFLACYGPVPGEEAITKRKGKWRQI